ncbi:hypothetical protein AB0M35_19960 [Micromonospora sp. NPDC051196]|uniref:hypothetical protein n=1 Tax=Micromonospora sp. NPDC051196 TaxID=3155281 RepID=UPI00341D0C72
MRVIRITESVRPPPQRGLVGPQVLRLVPGGGHFLLESHLETTVGHIRDFLTRAVVTTAT